MKYRDGGTTDYSPLSFFLHSMVRARGGCPFAVPVLLASSSTSSINRGCIVSRTTIDRGGGKELVFILIRKRHD
jgi:hypothetical protein